MNEMFCIDITLMTDLRSPKLRYEFYNAWVEALNLYKYHIQVSSTYTCTNRFNFLFGDSWCKIPQENGGGLV